MRISDGGGCNPGLFYYEYYHLFIHFVILFIVTEVSLLGKVSVQACFEAGCVWVDVIG